MCIGSEKWYLNKNNLLHIHGDFVQFYFIEFTCSFTNEKPKRIKIVTFLALVQTKREKKENNCNVLLSHPFRG